MRWRVVYCLLLLIGIILGIVFGWTKKWKSTWWKAVVNFLAIAVSTAAGILLLKSFTEHILYAQPMVVRMGKNIFAFVADIFVLELSLPICMALDAKIRKMLHLN